MTRDEQITEALKLLAPDLQDVGNCEYDIALMLDRVQTKKRVSEKFRATRSSKGTKALRRYKKALENLQKAYDELGAAQPWFSLGQYGVPNIVLREIHIATDFLRGSASPKRGDAAGIKAALDAAYGLLVFWGHNPSKTRSGKRDRLDRILANTDRSVYKHILSHPKPKIAKKLKGPTGTALLYHR
jgi:hypothetical protein